MTSKRKRAGIALAVFAVLLGWSLVLTDQHHFWLCDHYRAKINAEGGSDNKEKYMHHFDRLLSKGRLMTIKYDNLSVAPNQFIHQHLKSSGIRIYMSEYSGDERTIELTVKPSAKTSLDDFMRMFRGQESLKG